MKLYRFAWGEERSKKNGKRMSTRTPRTVMPVLLSARIGWSMMVADRISHGLIGGGEGSLS